MDNFDLKKYMAEGRIHLNENVYNATFDDDFGTFIDDLATVIGANYALYPGAPETGLPIEISPRDFNAWDEFGYEKHWNRIPEGQPFEITGDTPGMVEAPSLKNYTFIKMGNVIKGKIDIAEGRLVKEIQNQYDPSNGK